MRCDVVAARGHDDPAGGGVPLLTGSPALVLAAVLTPLAGGAPAHASLPGYSPLASAMSGHQLDVSGGSGSAFAPVIVWWGHGQSNQQWNFPSTNGQTGYISNENSGMCLTTYQVRTNGGPAGTRRKGRPWSLFRGT